MEIGPSKWSALELSGWYLTVSTPLPALTERHQEERKNTGNKSKRKDCVEREQTGFIYQSI
jgi:hypothetical protein